MKLKITISKFAEKTIGTSAELICGQTYSVEDLLYGLMLPSGNDAAHSISESIGLLMMYEDENELEKIKSIEIINKK